MLDFGLLDDFGGQTDFDLGPDLGAEVGIDPDAVPDEALTDAEADVESEADAEAGVESKPASLNNGGGFLDDGPADADLFI